MRGNQKVNGPLSIQDHGPTKISYYKLENLEKGLFQIKLMAATKAIEDVIINEFKEALEMLQKIGELRREIENFNTKRGLEEKDRNLTRKKAELKNRALEHLRKKMGSMEEDVLHMEGTDQIFSKVLLETVGIDPAKAESACCDVCDPIISDQFLKNPAPFLMKLFANEEVQVFLASLSNVDPFSENFSDMLCDCSGSYLTESGVSTDSALQLDILAILKKLKYFLNLPIGQVLQLLSQLCTQTVLMMSADDSEISGKMWILAFAASVNELFQTPKESETYKLLMRQFKSWVLEDVKTGEESGSVSTLEFYRNLELDLELLDPHATFPTSIYRRCDGRTLASNDAQTIEAVMGTVLTTTIKITRNVLDPKKNSLLASVYRPLGRVVCIVDDKVDAIGFSETVKSYFEYFSIDPTILVFGGNEVDKDMTTVEKILVALKTNNVSRNQPVLIMGGGVLSDTAGLACALYHRNTPYVMLSTSIVSGIDAGPSPRTCCDGFGYKNLYGAYHPPVMTLTDRMFWKTLKVGFVRHGIAEIVKMACVKDIRAFELLEQAGNLLVRTKFGTDMEALGDDGESTVDIEREMKRRGFSGEQHFQDVCDEIAGRAMEGYVRSEYGNLWETHQARPHAYGHTWSPGYELPAGMLHGHAVSTCMGYGAFMACYHWECQNYKRPTVQNPAFPVAEIGAHSEDGGAPRPWLPKPQMMRILNLISELELSLYHPIMDNVDVIWNAQVKMVEKRGGNLAAPVPKGEIGKCGYLTSVDKDCLRESLQKYKELVTGVNEATKEPRFARNGFGVQMHCHDVGLQDPSTVIKPGDITGHAGNTAPKIDVTNRKASAEGYLTSNGQKVFDSSAETSSLSDGYESYPLSDQGVIAPKNDDKKPPKKNYQEWIKEVQSKRHEHSTANMMMFGENSDGRNNSGQGESLPPPFPHYHLFADETAESYAMKQSTVVSPNIKTAAKITDRYEMFLPCMVGSLESQFLKMTAQMSGAKRILDVGTFTGMSAIAFAESSADAQVTTIEFDRHTADIAAEVFRSIDYNVQSRIHLLRGDARALMKEMALKKQKFDMIFLDADKDNYEKYYKLCMGYSVSLDDGKSSEKFQPLLAPNGTILADNTACALLYDENDDRRNALHRFNRLVAEDDRVEQVLLTVREGITMIRRKK